MKETVGAVVRRGGQANQAGVEIFQYLAPQVVDGAVALVDKDEIKELDGDLRVVDHRHRLFRLHHLGRIDLFRRRIEFLILEQRIHAPNGADADLAVLGDKGRFQALDIIQLGELAVVVIRQVRHEPLLGLFTEVPGIDQEQDTFGVGMFKQAIDRGNRRVGLAGAGGHLDQGAGAVIFERGFQLFDGRDLADSKAGRIQHRQILQTCTQGGRFAQPLGQGLGTMKGKYFP